MVALLMNTFILKMPDY